MRHSGEGSAAGATCCIMFDGTGVQQFCPVTLRVARGEQVAKGLVVNLHIRCLQPVLPALLLQAIHSLQDLRSKTIARVL